MNKPRFPDDPAFRFLRAGDVEGFHRAIEDRRSVDFSGADLRGVDFRQIDLRKVVLRDAYMRGADLRGCDLRQTDLSGASLLNAKISGTYFPHNLSPEEILLSIEHGTRLRTSDVSGY